MFTKQHYKMVAEVIKGWRRLNPNMEEKYFKSLIFDFTMAFETDNDKFDWWKFKKATEENHVKGQTKKA